METEYEVVVKASISSTLDKQKLKQLLVIALLDDLTMIPDGESDQLRVIEYHETFVEESL